MPFNLNLHLTVSNLSSIPKYEQIVNHIVVLIESKKLKEGELLPSINTTYKKLGVSRDTLINAYKKLQEMGYIGSRHGKGFFILESKKNKSRKKVFVLFDQMSGYKEALYQSLVKNLGANYSIDAFFYFFNKKVFSNLLLDNISGYDHYVVIPHFNEDVSDILKNIPPEKLLILDKDVPAMKGNIAAVYQNYDQDIYQTLKSNLKILKKYQHINMIFDWKNQYFPQGIMDGFNRFCKESLISCNFFDYATEANITKGSVYIVNSDNDLTLLIKMVKKKKLTLGKDIGIISYNDTPLKEVIADGLTVISTDFEEMGKTAASLIKTQRFERIENPFTLILRNSL